MDHLLGGHVAGRSRPRVRAAPEPADAGVELRVEVGGERVGVEVKRTDQPKLTPSVRHALEDLALDRVVVVHAGAHRFPLAPRVAAVPAADLLINGLAEAS